MIKKTLVAAFVAVGMVMAGAGVAEAASVSPSTSTGFPARVVYKWYESHRKVTVFQLPIGPPCWGVVIMQAGVTDLDGSAFCTTEAAWKAHPWGSAWEGGFPK